MAKEQTATYKGRSYRLVFIGDTKFGRRAKLAFTDGSKEFWVPASDVTVGGSAAPVVTRFAPARRPRRDCDDFCQGCRLCR